MSKCVYCNNELTESDNICNVCGSLQFNFNKLYSKTTKTLDKIDFFGDSDDDVIASAYNMYGTEDGEFRGYIFDNEIKHLYESRQKLLDSGKYKPNGPLVQDDLYPIIMALDKVKAKFDKKIFRNINSLKDTKTTKKRIDVISNLKSMVHELAFALGDVTIRFIKKTEKW